jgi:hypothetical protein
VTEKSLEDVHQVNRALREENDDLKAQLVNLQGKLDRINKPEVFDFVKAVGLEAAHQRLRWGAKHDGGKTDADWYWLIGYLGSKVLHTDNLEFPNEKDFEEKKLHRIITIAAAACNWHLAVLGKTDMRPGTIQPPEVSLAQMQLEKKPVTRGLPDACTIDWFDRCPSCRGSFSTSKPKNCICPWCHVNVFDAYRRSPDL